MTKYEKSKLISLIIFGAILLVLFYEFSKNGRYVVQQEPLLILDTRTGTTYAPKARKYIEIKDFEKMEKKSK